MLLTGAAVAGCADNNGDIGLWYGVWALESVKVNGTPDTSFDNDGSWTNFQFQNNIVCISRNTALHEKTECWGTWRQQDDRLLLDFGHHDGANPPGTGIYAAPGWIFMTSGTVNSLQIIQAAGKSMTLAMTAADGRQIEYRLKKTY